MEPQAGGSICCPLPRLDKLSGLGLQRIGHSSRPEMRSEVDWILSLEDSRDPSRDGVRH
jgi:hypothetical protein